MLAALLVAQALTLRDVQERARQNDPRAQQALAQSEGASAKRDETRWAAFPAFETTLWLAGPTPEHRLVGGSNDPSLTDITPGTRDWLHGQLGVQVHADVQAILPLYTFGKLTSGKEAAGQYLKATEALLQRARDQAAFDATRAYWGWQTARNADASVQKIRDRLTDAKKTAQQLLEEKSEQITRADAAKLDYLTEEIEAKHAEAVKNRDLALTGLRLLIGVKPDEQVEIALQDLPQEIALPPASGEVLRKALERRPETHAAEAAVAARQALVDLARARLWPDLALVGGVRFTETTNADSPPSPFANNPDHEASAYVALALRGTFDVPQKLARLHQAEADFREALAIKLGAEQLIRLEVQQALGDLAEARERVARYTKESAIGKQLATQAGVAFDSGLGEVRELLEDTLLFARADGERLHALFDAQIAWAALEKATGGPL